MALNNPKEKNIILYILISVLVLLIFVLAFFALDNYTSIVNTLKYLLVVLRPLIIGGIVAYLLKSTCNYFEKLLFRAFNSKKSRITEKTKERISGALAILATYSLWGIVILILLWIIVPQFVRSLTSLTEKIYTDLPEMFSSLTEKINEILRQNETFEILFGKSLEEYYIKISEWLMDGFPGFIQNFGNKILLLIVGLLSTVKDFVIGLILSVLILLNRKTLSRRFKTLIKTLFTEGMAKYILEEFAFADRVFSGYFIGKIIDSTLIGVIYYIVLSIMKIPYSPLVSVVCGVTNIIPFFGPFIGAIPSAIIIFSDEPVKVVFFVIFVSVMQMIDGNIIEPHIVGGNINMSGLGVLFAVVLFGGLFGFFGLLIGVPVFAVIYDIIKKAVRVVAKRRNMEKQS